MNTYERIKELAKERKLSIRQLEMKFGYSNGYIGSWKRQTPNSTELVRLADYFGVSVDYLLGRNQAPKWADKDDLIELDKLLDSNVNMAYNGENLTPEEIQRVKDILTGVFWEYAEKDKKLKK
ncbi:helix-turn-helix domain-containing protein [Enterococcus sp. LJL120]